jgi:hypothetical protein
LPIPPWASAGSWPSAWHDRSRLAAQRAAIVLLVVALGTLTSAELVTSAGKWFPCIELASTRLRERYISVFKTSMAVQQAARPVLVTTVLVDWGRQGWLALASLQARSPAAARAPPWSRRLLCVVVWLTFER